MTRTWRERTAAIAGLVVLAMWVPADRVSAGTRQVQTVTVSAERFSFTPSELRTKVGVPIEIRLSSEDTDHGFRIPRTPIDIRIPKRGRGTAVVTFTPTAAGRYTFECSHVCGAGHSSMRGTIVVTE